MDSSKTKEEAIKKAKLLVSKMKSKGWKTEVWENLGWHYSISKGLLCVNGVKYNDGKCKYYALLSGGDYPGTGECYWGDSRCFKDPNDAVTAVMKSAEDFVNKVQKVVLETKKYLAKEER